MNSGPPVPQTGALTGLRYAPKISPKGDLGTVYFTFRSGKRAKHRLASADADRRRRGICCARVPGSRDIRVSGRAERPRRRSSLRLPIPSPGPASSIAAPSKEGIRGPRHRWCERHTTRFGGHVPGIRTVGDMTRSPARPPDVVREHYRRVAANLILVRLCKLTAAAFVTVASLRMVSNNKYPICAR